MNKKMLIILITIVVLLLGFGIFKFYNYMYGQYKPGKNALEQRKIALIYCSQNGDNMQQVVDKISSKVKLESIKLEPVVPYPAATNEFIKRIKNENNDLAQVTLKNDAVKVRDYGLIIMASPIVDGGLCPLLKKFVQENRSNFDKKALSTISLLKYKESALPIPQYIYARLDKAIPKPSLIIDPQNNIESLDNRIDNWLEQMVFTRAELRK